jgi:hypothetical protein
VKTEKTEIARMMRKLQNEDLSKWPCKYRGQDGCDHEPFNTHQARNNHIRNHHPGKPLPKMSHVEMLARKRLQRNEIAIWRKKRFPSNRPQYKKEHYNASKMKRYSKGKTSQGKTFTDPQMADYVINIAKAAGYVDGRYIGPEQPSRITPSGRKRLSESLKQRWAAQRQKGIKSARLIQSSPLPTTCSLCNNKEFSTRGTLGSHVRKIHKISLYDLPKATTKEETPEKDTPEKDTTAEIKEPGKATVTIQDGVTTVTITTRFGLKELVTYILET